MKCLWLLIGGFIVASLIAITSIYFIHTSLWFLWEVVPAASIKVGFDTTRPNATILNRHLNKLPSELASLVSHSRRLVITNSSIALIPSDVSTRQHLKQALEDRGWQVNFLGHVLIATKEPAPKKSIISAIKKTVAAKPRRPLAMAKINADANPYLNHDTYLIARSTASAVTINITESEHSQSLDKASESIFADQLSFALPGQVLADHLGEVEAVLDTTIAERLGLIDINPSITASLSSEHTVAMHSAGSTAAIAISGDVIQFTTIVENWIKNAEAKTRPERRAFRLPDGQIGFETTPGDPQPVFAITSDEAGCRAPAVPDTTLWLCSNATAASLGTSQEAAQQQLELVQQENWHLTLGRALLANFLPEIQSLSAQGQAQSAQIELKIAP